MLHKTNIKTKHRLYLQSNKQRNASKTKCTSVSNASHQKTTAAERQMLQSHQ